MFWKGKVKFTGSKYIFPLYFLCNFSIQYRHFYCYVELATVDDNLQFAKGVWELLLQPQNYLGSDSISKGHLTNRALVSFDRICFTVGVYEGGVVL